jgi:LacI family transcriptional regulator
MPAITIRDVAAAAGTSVATVSAVLSGNGRHNIRVGTATRERVLRAAAELNYAPNPIARSLVTRKTGVLGLVFPYSSAFTERNPFFTQVMSGVLDGVIRARYNVMLHTAIDDEEQGADWSGLLDPRVDGLILVLPDRDNRIVAECTRRQFPYVAVVCRPDSPEVYAINSDDHRGGLLATQHLLALGHVRIAHLMGNPDVATAVPRRDGYLEALRAAGIAPDPALLVGASFEGNRGYRAMQTLLALPSALRPTAVFAANDLCADGALRALTEWGVRVPEDISLVGYDDTWFAAMMRPPLSSVHMPIYEMGMAAAAMLVALVEGQEVPDRQPLFPVSLTVRGSSAAPPIAWRHSPESASGITGDN